MDSNSRLLRIRYPKIYACIDRSHPDNLKLRLENLMIGSGKKIHWICVNGHKRHLKVQHRVAWLWDCIDCHSTYLKDEFPEIYAQIDRSCIGNLDTTLLTYGSTTELTWICSRGHKWLGTVASRTSGGGRGCNTCAIIDRGNSRAIAPREKSLGHLYPQLIPEWNDSTDIFTVYPHSNREYNWKCLTCGNQWLTQANVRTRGCGCDICSSKRTGDMLASAPKEKSLGNLYPQLIPEWNDSTDIFTVYPASNRKYNWKCSTCGGFWRAMAHDRAEGTGCMRCKKPKLEKTATEYFKELGIEYIAECSIQGYHLRRYDFYVDNAMIELDGIQHFEPIEFYHREYGFEERQQRDREKTIYALNSGFRVIRIDYTCIDYLASELEKALASTQRLYLSNPSMYEWLGIPSNFEELVERPVFKLA